MAVWGATLCQKVWAPASLSYFSTSISMVLCLLTAPGNLLVCWAILRNPNNDLRMPFTILILNLAIADLIVGAIVDPLSVQYHIQEALRAPHTKGPIQALHIGFFISCTASVFCLGGLTLDRYLAITSPLWYRANVSYQRVSLISVMVWLCAVALSLLYLKFGYINYGFIFANTAVLGTIFLLVFCYVGIFRRLRLQVRDLDLIHDSKSENRAKLRAMLWEKKLTKTYFLMLAFFLFCFVPSCAAMYMVNWCCACDCVTVHCLRDTHLLLVLLSSAVNPIIYGWRLLNFRKAFASLVILRRPVVIPVSYGGSPVARQETTRECRNTNLSRRSCWVGCNDGGKRTMANGDGEKIDITKTVSTPCSHDLIAHLSVRDNHSHILTSTHN